MSAFTWSVSTPEGVVASGQCEFLVVPTTGGELGVLAGHAALVAGVVPGQLRVSGAAGPRNPPSTSMVSVSAGIVEVRDNQVRLLVTGAEALPSAGAAAPVQAATRPPA